MGLYLYCIRRKQSRTFPINIKGIDGKEAVSILPYRELEAIVSKISLKEFDSAKVRQKAEEDLQWIKEKALIHDRVIEKAMKINNKIFDLIPMRFGTIFKNDKNLEKALSKDYPKIISVLKQIHGKQEWSLKVYLKDNAKLEQIVKENNKNIKKKEDELASLNEGMAFFMEEELKEMISKQVNKTLNVFKDTLFENLKRNSVAAKKEKILGNELTGKQDPMILNASCLVSARNITDFKKEVDKLNREIGVKGFYLEYSGPYPAYSFSNY